MTNFNFKLLLGGIFIALKLNWGKNMLDFTLKNVDTACTLLHLLHRGWKRIFIGLDSIKERSRDSTRLLYTARL